MCSFAVVTEECVCSSPELLAIASDARGLEDGDPLSREWQRRTAVMHGHWARYARISGTIHIDNSQSGVSGAFTAWLEMRQHVVVHVSSDVSCFARSANLFEFPSSFFVLLHRSTQYTDGVLQALAIGSTCHAVAICPARQRLTGPAHVKHAHSRQVPRRALH